MKLSIALVVVLALGLSAVNCQPFHDELATQEADDFTKALMNQEDFEIVDFDDALRKVRILKELANLVAEAQDSVEKRSAKDVFNKIIDFFENAADKIENFFTEAWHEAKAAFHKLVGNKDFKAFVKAVIPYIDSSMTVAECEKAIAEVPEILDDGVELPDGVIKPLCVAALHELQHIAESIEKE